MKRVIKSLIFGVIISMLVVNSFAMEPVYLLSENEKDQAVFEKIVPGFIKALYSDKKYTLSNIQKDFPSSARLGEVDFVNEFTMNSKGYNRNTIELNRKNSHVDMETGKFYFRPKYSAANPVVVYTELSTYRVANKKNALLLLSGAKDYYDRLSNTLKSILNIGLPLAMSQHDGPGFYYYSKPSTVGSNAFRYDNNLDIKNEIFYQEDEKALTKEISRDEYLSKYKGVFVKDYDAGNSEAIIVEIFK